MSEQDLAQNCRGQFENKAPLISFEPVPVRPRHDRWTVERQIAFVQRLAAVAPARSRQSRQTLTRLARERA